MEIFMFESRNKNEAKGEPELNVNVDCCRHYGGKETTLY